jgi:hypothetical protein
MNITRSNHEKIQKGTQLHFSDWPKYQKDDIEKVPSYIQKGTQLLEKKCSSKFVIE